jgi:hypothetical protein
LAWCLVEERARKRLKPFPAWSYSKSINTFGYSNPYET